MCAWLAISRCHKFAYPNANEVVQYLLEWEKAGLDHNSEEVYEVVGNVPDWRETTEEESPSPELKVNSFLHHHSNFDTQHSSITLDTVTCTCSDCIR